NEIAYYDNHHFTKRPQGQLAERLVTVVAPEMARVKFTSGGSEANEAAIRLARAYHVERGQSQRWRVISPAQAYHGSTFGTLALSGRRRSLQQPYEPYLPEYFHLSPATPRFDPTGEAALAELDRIIENVGAEAIAQGSREFDLGHTWDGAPLPCAVGLAVLDVLVEHRLVDRVRDRGPGLREELQAALKGSSIVGEVRGRGFLLGVELVDPRDRRSFLPDQLDAASLVDDTAFDLGLLVSSSHSTPDGYAGDEILLAPAYTSTDAELAQMVERFAATIASVERTVLRELGRQSVATAPGP